jgi:prevent-host-death family protein
VSTVGIKDLKNRLTSYLRKTKRGEEIVVTERGKPIALIQPIAGAVPVKSLEARLAKLAAQGAVQLPTRKPLKKIRRITVGGRPTSRLISEERR